MNINKIFKLVVKQNKYLGHSLSTSSLAATVAFMNSPGVITGVGAISVVVSVMQRHYTFRPNVDRQNGTL